MKLAHVEYDHIEIYDETGRLVVSISDEEIVKDANYRVEFCETDEMFKGKEG